MRVWPYQMLDVLPTKQLVSQWRECLAISGSLASEKGLNHVIVNRVKDYPIEHFAAYCDLVRQAFKKRGFKIGDNTIQKLNNDINYQNLKYETTIGEIGGEVLCLVNGEPLFKDFHNDRYIKQCMYGMQERYDCGMINQDEWTKLSHEFGYLMDER